MLFKLTKDDVLTKYKDQIASIWDKTNTVILTDTDTSIGRFKKSDIILSYDLDGYLAIECERAFKKYYDPGEWAILSLRAMADAQASETASGIITACTISPDYIDYIRYKKEWLDWADEIARAQRTF